MSDTPVCEGPFDSFPEPSPSSFTATQSYSSAKRALANCNSSSASTSTACSQLVGALAQPRRHVEQDAMNLRLLLIQQPNQVVVLLDRLQRLNEYGLAAGRGAVCDSLHATALLHLHRNHEALATDGDQLFLNRTTLGKPPQISP